MSEGREAGLPPVASAAQDAAPDAGRTEWIRKMGSSVFNYWFGYVANISLVIWLASRAFAGFHLAIPATTLIAYAVTGLVSWTLTEYLLHRFLYHELASFLSEGHALHHKSPRALIGVPWYLTTIAIIAIFFAVTRIGRPATVGMFMATNWFGYILYCVAHHGSHHWTYRNRWLKHMKRHHLIHHARPQYNWGFTTTFWDRVFRTYYDIHSQGRRKPDPA